MKLFYQAGKLFCLLLFALNVNAQKITINAEDYRQPYQGGGISYGLYIGHHWSMSQANQDSIMKLMYGDVNMKYIQSYEGRRPSNHARDYEHVAKYVKQAHKYRPDLKVVIVLSNYPTDLTKKVMVDEKEKEYLDVTIPGVYDKVAKNYLDILQKLYDEGVNVDMFNLVNEPDYQKEWKFGHEDAKLSVGIILQKSVARFREMLKDPELNPDGLKCPQFIAPSNIAPGGARNYINYWKNNNREAWEQVDIVGTHQYINGDSEEAFAAIQQGLEGRGFIQTEQHTNKGDNLGKLKVNNVEISDEARSPLSLASMFSSSVNHGVESWFYFVVNTPSNYANAGLIQTKWAGKPVPYKTYYAFKQLHNAQEMGAHNISYDKSSVKKAKIVCFRSRNNNKVVAHITNYSVDTNTIELEINGLTGNYYITGYKAWQTDSVKNIEEVANVELETAQGSLTYKFPPYSLTTIEFTSNTTPDVPHIDFAPIADKQFDSPDFEPVATSSNSQPITFTVESGEAEMKDNKVHLTGIGEVTIKASQAGAADVFRTFSIRADYLRNIALNKPTTADLEETKYPARYATDGIITSNLSRWLATKTNYPHWLEVDLGGMDSVIGVGLWSGASGYNSYISDFTVERWDEATKDWVAFITEKGNRNAVYQKLVPQVKTSKVRLHITKAYSKQIKLYEFEVYGVTVPTERIEIASESGSTEIKEDRGTLQLIAKVYPENAGFKNPIWKVSDENIASIDSNGLLTALNVGTVDVIALPKDNKGKSDTLTITISNQTVEVSNIVISNDIGSSKVPNTVSSQFFAEIFPENAENKTYTWSVTNGTGKATITENGLFTPDTLGTVFVEATPDDPFGRTSIMKIEITQGKPVTSISVFSAGNVSQVVENGTLQFTAEVLPNKASDKTYTWSIINGTGTATISEDGLLTAETSGTITVVATANDLSGVSGKINITVIKPVTGLTADRNANNVKCYPNPAVDFLNIQVQEAGSVKIYNLVGQPVYFTPFSANELLNINVAELPRGQYIVKLVSGETNKTFKVLLK